MMKGAMPFFLRLFRTTLASAINLSEGLSSSYFTESAPRFLPTRRAILTVNFQKAPIHCESHYQRHNIQLEASNTRNFQNNASGN